MANPEQKPIRFNMRAVPRSKRSNETLLEMVDEYTEKLSNREWRKALCIHEAAHAIYSERFGCKRPVFTAPLAFEYDKLSGVFLFYQAAVEVDVEKDWRQTVWVSLAGPVAERALTPKSAWDTESCGDDGETVFRALRRGRVPTRQWTSYIKRVQSQIRADLRDPAVRKAIEQRAAVYQRILNKAIKKAAARDALLSYAAA